MNNQNIEALYCDSSSIINTRSNNTRNQSSASDKNSLNFEKQSTQCLPSTSSSTLSSSSPTKLMIPSKTNLCLDLNIQTAGENRKVFTCQVPLSCPETNYKNSNTNNPFIVTALSSEKYNIHFKLFNKWY